MYFSLQERYRDFGTVRRLPLRMQMTLEWHVRADPELPRSG